MFKNIFASLVILFGSVAPSYALSAGDGLYYYRYSNTRITKTAGSEDPSASKDITAFFMGGVGVEFSEVLPLKPQWEDDNWVITGGSLPPGITFNSATRTFEGTPTSASNTKIEMTGYDSSGAAVADASVSFDVYSVPANVVKLDLYAHKDKFFVNTPAVPAGIEVCNSCWSTISPIPPGLTIVGHNIDGTPTQSGTFPIFIQGHDNNGVANIAYIGKITVEDAPSFPKIADKLRKFDTQLNYAWFNEAVQKAKRTIGNANDVRYSMEVQSGSKLPGTVKLTGPSNGPVLTGNIYNTYEQATVRYKVIDTDGAVGYSNWFKVGSLGGAELCTLPDSSPIDVDFSAGIPGSYRIPVTGSGVTYTLNGGTLPDGLSFDPVGGVLSGTPTSAGTVNDIMVAVNYANNASQNIVCGPYNINVKAKDAVTVQMSKEVYRTGDSVSGQIVLSNAVATPATVTLAAGSALPSGLTFNSSTRTVSGSVAQAGDYSANFTVTAANGTVYTATMNIPVLPPLSLAAISNPVNVARYAVSNNLASLVVDQASVWKTYSLEVVGTALPQGISIDTATDKLVGGTSNDVGSYGPFTIRLRDESGDYVDSNSFSIVVGARAGLEITETKTANFTVNKIANLRPVTISLPPKATNLTLDYSISPALPAGLSLDANGYIVGTPTVNGVFPGYVVTGTDSENATISSAPFTITISDPATPDAINFLKISGNVGVFLTTPSVNLIADTLVGSVNDVTYVGAEPSIPGLTFDTQTGLLSGIPTSTFNGMITIRFKDGAGRDGDVMGPLSILPYPAVEMTQPSYDLPRLANAANYGIKANDNGGFVGGITWSLAPDSAPLPLGLSVYNNKIVGSTTSSERTVTGLKLQATDSTTGITVKTNTFSIKIGTRVDLALAPVPSMAISYVTPSGVEVSRSPFTSTAPTGSFINPLTYSIKNAGEVPASLTLNAATGQFATFPSYVGTWPVTLKVVDAEGNAAEAAVTARTTLDGIIDLQPTSINTKVRVGEEFETAAITPSNFVGDVTYGTSTASLPAGVTFDETNGTFAGNMAEPATFSRDIRATDSHNRSSHNGYPVTVQVQAVPALALAPIASTSATQYSETQKINLTLPGAQNAIGDITYAITGNVPGTLVYRLADGTNYLAATMTAITGSLPNDAIVFDTESRVLNGVPSQAGTFNLALVAVDSHGAGTENTASSSFTITVAPAENLTVSLNKNNETLFALTSQPTIAVTTTNAAYGKVTWTRITGTLPSGVTASTTDTALNFTGFPSASGTFSNIVYRATDGAGRTADVPAVTFSVQARQALALIASSNPKGMIVNTATSPLEITATNAALGQPVTFNVTGVVPTGISYATVDGKLRFTGTPTVIGNYPNITVSATDSAGSTANLTVAINVLSSSSPIDVTVYNVTTKVGKPFTMAPPYATASLATANSYGELTFSSDNIPAGKGLTIDSATGELLGTATSVGTINLDLKVTDETNRLTSKPVVINVISPLQITVASQVTTRQGDSLTTTIDTQFKIGAVTYTKGTGNWPVGITVNPTTGAISGEPTSPVGTYPDLTISGTDASGDTQLSNTFSIIVDEVMADPVISSVNQDGANRLKFTVGTAGSFTPTVKDSIRNQTWTFEGTTYAINQTLPAGLTFNTTNGTISGTPTEAAILNNVVITVTSSKGATSSTMPFWLGVAPAGSLALVSGAQDIEYNMMTGETLTTDPLVFSSLTGTLKFTTVQKSDDIVSTLNTQTGQVTEVIPANLTLLPRIFFHSFFAEDEFGRSVQLAYRFNVSGMPTVSYVNQSLEVGDSINLAPTTTFTVNPAFSISPALPAGVSINPSTGVISGTISAEWPQTTYTVTMLSSGKTITTTVTLSAGAPVAAAIHNSFSIKFSGPNTNSGNGARIAEIQGVDAFGNVLAPNAIYMTEWGHATGPVQDGYASTFRYSDVANGGVTLEYYSGARVAKFRVKMNGQQDIKNIQVCYSDTYGNSPFYPGGTCTSTFQLVGPQSGGAQYAQGETIEIRLNGTSKNLGIQ